MSEPELLLPVDPGGHVMDRMRTSRSTEISRNGDGDLVWAGHDLGPEVQMLQPGATEYEFWRTVPAAEVPALVAALGGSPGDDAADLVAARFTSDVQLAEFAALHDVTTSFHSWIATSWDD